MSTIRQFLENVFDIREGELMRALAMQLNIFLIITTLLILKPTVNSLFLSTYGIESLPFAFILVAIFAGIITSIYSKIIRRIRYHFLIIGTLTFSVCSLIFFGVALRVGIGGQWILYMYYIWVAIFALLSTSQFWLLANIVFNDREIKRLVGFIGAGGIAGGIFGGYLTSYLTNYIESTDLSLVGAFTISLCIPLTLLIWYRHKQLSKNEHKSVKQIKKSKDKHPLTTILKSKHLTYIAAIVGVSTIVAKLVDYQFGGIASSLITDPNELTSFFGFWFSTFNVASLIIQIVATRYILERLGVGGALLILPIFICMSTVLLIIAPELLFSIILLKMSDGSLKQSINKSGMELLILPINIKVKNTTKPFIDVFIDSIAAGVSGLILIFVVNGLSLSSMVINLIILAFTLIWVFLVINVRKEYLKSFKLKILKNTNFKNLSKVYVKNGALISSLNNVLLNGTKVQILGALEKVKPLKDSRLNDTIVKLLQHRDADVKVEAIQHLYHKKNIATYNAVQKLTNNRSLKVKRAAFAYLIEHTPAKNIKSIEQHLESNDSKQRGLNLLNLVAKVNNNPKLKTKYKIKERIKNRLKLLGAQERGNEKYINKLYCIKSIARADIPELHNDLKAFFKDENPLIVRQAILAAGKTKNKIFVNDLVRFLYVKPFVKQAKRALQRYDGRIVFYLEEFAKQKSTDVKLLRKYPFVLKKTGTKAALNLLHDLLGHKDTLVHQACLKALIEHQHNFPNLRLEKKKKYSIINQEILAFQNSLARLHVFMDLPAELKETAASKHRFLNILKEKHRNYLKNIFDSLSLVYSPDDMATILKGLTSKKTNIKTTALEFMDNILDLKQREILVPLFEVGVIDLENRNNILKLKLKIFNDVEYFEKILLYSSDISLKVEALIFLSKLNDTKYHDLIFLAQRSTDPKTREAYKIFMLDDNDHPIQLKIS